MLSILSNPDFHIAATAVLSWLAGFGLCWLLSPANNDEAITELEDEVRRLRVKNLRTECERDAAERLYADLTATSQPRDPATGRLVKRAAA